MSNSKLNEAHKIIKSNMNESQLYWFDTLTDSSKRSLIFDFNFYKLHMENKYQIESDHKYLLHSFFERINYGDYDVDRNKLRNKKINNILNNQTDEKF